jgi:hypothetical protein
MDSIHPYVLEAFTDQQLAYTGREVERERLAGGGRPSTLRIERLRASVGESRLDASAGDRDVA